MNEPQLIFKIASITKTGYLQMVKISRGLSNHVRYLGLRNCCDVFVTCVNIES